MRVLIIDDSLLAREILKEMCVEEGFETALAAGGEKGLELLGEGTFDLVLLDVNMPGLSGLDVVQSIRSRSHTPDVPILVVSSDTDQDQIMKLLEAGANDYLIKPASKDSFQSKLEILGIGDD